ncbi:hypothetical protein EV175_004339, partial [Coemansia sp. RSA 1933]
KQQQQQQPGETGSQGISEQSSPMNDPYTSPQARPFHSRMNSSTGGSNQMPLSRTSALREHPTTFPRLSSFSISQSNVRSDGTTGGGGRPMTNAPPHYSPVSNTTGTTTTTSAATPQPYQKYKRTSSPRFVMPVHRVSSSFKPHHSHPYAMTSASAGVSPTVGPANGSTIQQDAVSSPPLLQPPTSSASLARETGTNASSPTPPVPRSVGSPPGYASGAPMVALSTSSSSSSLAQSAARFESTRQPSSFSSAAATTSSARSPVAAAVMLSGHHSPGSSSIVTAASLN